MYFSLFWYHLSFPFLCLLSRVQFWLALLLRQGNPSYIAMYSLILLLTPHKFLCPPSTTSAPLLASPFLILYEFDPFSPC